MLPINPTIQDIEQKVDLLLRIMPDADRNHLIRAAQEVFNVQAANYHVIEDKGSMESWLLQKKAAIAPWRFWNRYREYLQIEKNYPDAVLTRLGNLTDDILDKMFDPAIQRQIDKWGLVVGQVQSGKTSNYIGLICKAVDAGFRLVIILAGTLNNLRSQTQMRMDEGFFGKESETDRKFQGGGKKIGVGNLPGHLIAAHPLTSSHEKGDFNQRARIMQMVDFDTAEPIVLVVKKNGSVLRNLYDWLAANGEPDMEGNRLIRNKPLLLIDDEADLASINTSKDPNKATKINHQIRSLLRLFERSAYVGYTATPFANIFIPIDDDELFPRDFIINLPAPSNYIGPEKVFGFDMPEEEEENDAVLPVVNRIDDYQHFVPDGHKIDDPLPDHLPSSLSLAIRCFILTCAVRRLRGQVGEHNSMLVHITRFKRWQGRIKELVEVEFEHYRWGIEQNDRRTLDLFRRTFEEDAPGYHGYPTVTEAILNSSLRELDAAAQAHAWADVQPHLHEAASRIRVREINGGSADVLNYFDNPSGLSVIAIGGDKLSRGLTLEGLSVSYYLRASKMYDTLMQMGRWFGYRRGYVDLCRLFTSAQLNEWYCHITKASEELREEFAYMSEVASVTPRDYALKVRTHPKTLLITASNKMQFVAKLRVGFSGKLVQSYLLRTDKEAIESNLTAVKKLLASSGAATDEPNRILWRTADVQAILRFINEFKIHPELASSKPDLVARYVELTRQRGELTDWVVAMPKNTSSGNVPFTFQLHGELLSAGMTRRSREQGTGDDRYYINKSNIISPRHEYFDFPDFKTVQGAKREILNRRPPQRALLLVYPLNPEGILEKADLPIMAYAISFPRSVADVTVEYAVHKQLISLFDVNDLTDSDYENED
ncbi:MAG: endonuclease [Saprospiraceae bacterium]|nr:MAG: endonuclease [Saprospiraceae bacterium]